MRPVTWCLGGGRADDRATAAPVRLFQPVRPPPLGAAGPQARPPSRSGPFSNTARRGGRAFLVFYVGFRLPARDREGASRAARRASHRAPRHALVSIVTRLTVCVCVCERAVRCVCESVVEPAVILCVGAVMRWPWRRRVACVLLGNRGHWCVYTSFCCVGRVAPIGARSGDVYVTYLGALRCPRPLARALFLCRYVCRRYVDLDSLCAYLLCHGAGVPLVEGSSAYSMQTQRPDLIPKSRDVVR